MLELAIIINKFEYSLLGSELKNQTDIANDQYKLLNDHIEKMVVTIEKIKVIKLILLRDLILN